jgi:PiT family inorganic phosphate transporter
MDIWLILTIIGSFLLAFSMGANDASNSLGTSYGTHAIPLKWILANGAIAEFVGAMWCSGGVTTTLSSSVISDLDSLPT